MTNKRFGNTSVHPDPEDLTQLRRQIGELDQKGMELLHRRFEISRKIGEYKCKNRSGIFDPERENIVIAEAQKHFDGSMKDKIASVMGTVMRISRENQYEILMEKDPDWEPGRQIRSAPDVIPTPEQIACQGIPGAYSHLTAAKVFPESRRIPVQSFEETCRKVLDGECSLAVLPLENTTAGTVNDVYDLLADFPLYIVRAFSVPIRHHLLLVPGADPSRITTCLSHPQALAQCSKYIRKMGWKAVEVENTAVAVQKAAAGKDPSVCAIGSKEAAVINGLQVSEETICDSEHNQTRFVAISKDLIIPFDAARISLSFHLPHQRGSLVSVLNLFAERGLNLTKIQSRPVADKPWEYSFWADLTAEKGNREAILALYQLSKELPFIKLAGWYEETVVEL